MTQSTSEGHFPYWTTVGGPVYGSIMDAGFRFGEEHSSHEFTLTLAFSYMGTPGKGVS